MDVRNLFKNLGVSDEAITSAVLSELGLSKEEAVRSLADQLGVEYKEVSSFELSTADTEHEVPAPAAAIQHGERVQTSQGEAIAILIPGLDLETIQKVAGGLSALSN